MASQAQPQLEILLRVVDIVDLTGVGGSAVVTNWRARSPKFPQPRIGGSQPLFELRDILDWLRFDGPRGREVVEPTAAWRWPRYVEAYFQQADQPEPADRRSALVALVAVRHLLGAAPAWAALVGAADPGAALHAAARAAEAVAERRHSAGGMSLRGLLTAQLELGPADAVRMIEVAEVLDRHEASFEDHLAPVLALEPAALRRRPQRTSTSLAALMVALGRVSERSTVYDPAVGEGDALVAAAEAAHDTVRVTGRDVSAEASFVALARLVVRGCTSATILEPADSLRAERRPDDRYSVILLDPPVSERSASTDGHSLNRWIDHALVRLLDRGRLVVVLPLHEIAHVRAARRRPDQRLQSLLMSTFATHTLDAVVVLPRGLRPDIVGPIAVLAMTSADDAAAVGDDERPTDVPVFSVGEPPRDATLDPVEELAKAFTHAPPDGVDHFGVDFVHRIDVPISALWSTLDGLAESVEPSRGSSSRLGSRSTPGSSRSTRRSAPLPDAVEALAPPSARDELASMMESADALSVLRSPVSRNSLRLAAFESPSMRSDLMWEREAVRSVVEPSSAPPATIRTTAEVLKAIADARGLVLGLDAAAGDDSSHDARRVHEIVALLDQAVEQLGSAPTADRSR